MFADAKGRTLLRELYRQNKDAPQQKDSLFLKFCMKSIYNNAVPLTSDELADVEADRAPTPARRQRMAPWLKIGNRRKMAIPN